MTIGRLTFKSADFQDNFKVKRTIDTFQDWDWALEIEFRNYQDAHRAERTSWCLYHLMQDSDRSAAFENALVLQHLDNSPNSQLAKEADKIDQEIYRCLSDIAALERMADLLEFHRPMFGLPDAEELREDPRQAFQVKSKLHEASGEGNHAVGLGPAIRPLCDFSLPLKRDMMWVAERDHGCQLLSNVWSVARTAYQATLQAASVPQKFIDPQLALMAECDSQENEARLALERKQILDQIRASNDLRRAEIAYTVTERAGLLPTQERAKNKKGVLYHQLLRIPSLVRRQRQALTHREKNQRSHGPQYCTDFQKPRSHGRSSNGCFQTAVRAPKTGPEQSPRGKNSSPQWVL